MATKLSADELLNRALTEILRNPGDYRYSIDISPDLPWPDWRNVSHHLDACPDAAVTAAGGEDRVVGSCNVAIVSMTVKCPHFEAPAKLDTYGHLSWLLDEMHEIGRQASWCNKMLTVVMCERCTTNRAELWRLGLRREPYCHDCSRSVPGVYEMIAED